jgi:hypothetical protein
MDEAALFGCIDWVAQGFEIVQKGTCTPEICRTWPIQRGDGTGHEIADSASVPSDLQSQCTAVSGRIRDAFWSTPLAT